LQGMADQEKPAEEERKSLLHGLVVATAEEGHVTVLCASMPMSVRLPPPEETTLPIIPGCWVNFEMDLNTGKNHIIEECEPKYKTYLFDDGSFQVVCPACWWLEDGMMEDTKVAYTPFFRFVDDPDDIIWKGGEWIEWYEVVLSPSKGGFLLKVDKILRAMAGCVEPGALPGQMPTDEQILEAMRNNAPIGDYKGVKEVISCQLGLVIGHVEYDRVFDERSGKYTAYGSGRGGGFRGGNNRGGRGGYGGGRGGYNNWDRGYDSTSDRSVDGNWRVAQRQSNEQMPSMQYRRTNDFNKKRVKAALVYTPRGLFMSKLEENTYNEKDWLHFSKSMKSDMTVTQEKRDAKRDTYPPYILQHTKLPDHYGGKTRVKGEFNEWNIQVLVQARYGQLRNGSWYDPSFFNKISCSFMLCRKATRLLEEKKDGWAKMNEEEKSAVWINVWLGMGNIQMLKLNAIDEFPHKFDWEVKDFPATNFVQDEPLDVARAAGAIAAIVF
ncbi:hypothetical protein PMAYCL1PPCAC_11162, partial [Pristionchus mayeri]